ncbi:MAG: copper homeostasis protein CutC [Fusobacteriaceae bacterium]
MIKEACVESFLEAVKAIEKGATRIELCENLSAGGTTPSYGTIKQSVNNLSVPIFIMIRPRSGNFCYSKAELDIMKDDIIQCKKLGVKGVVFGVLNNNNKIDYLALKSLIKLSKPMEVTFHKAIDEIDSPELEIPNLINLGVSRILSSGKEDTAFKGAILLNKMIEVANNNLIIVVAGKVTHDNINEVSKIIKSSEFHGKKIV